MVTPGNTITDLNGTSHVTVVAAPAASTYRVVLSLRVYNRDTAAVTPTLVEDTSGTEREYEVRTGMAAGGFWDIITIANKYVLDATTKSLKMFLGGAASTTNPVVHASWIDITL